MSIDRKIQSKGKRELLKSKKTAIVLYVIYVTFLTLLLIFGGKVSSFATKTVSAILNKKNITSVTSDISAEDELFAGEYQYPQYTAQGRFRGDAGLEFTSLDPEYLTVNKKGGVLADMSFEGDVFDGRVKVTSKYDKDFEQVLSFRFVKKYPDVFTSSYFVKGYEYDSPKLYIGVPVYTYSSVESDVEYNVHDYTVEYDDEYFTASDDGTLIPIKTTADGQTLSFTVRYANGASAVSKSFTIEEWGSEITEIDEVLLDGHTPDEYVVKRGWAVAISLLKDGVTVPVNYTVEFPEKNDVIQNNTGMPGFKTAGDKQITVTLPSGFSKSVTVKVRNTVELPTLTDKTARETHTITMLDTDVTSFKFKFGKDVTFDEVKYEFDSSVIGVSPASRGFTLTPKSCGTTTLKLIVDDGFTRFEDTYTVQIKENTNVVAILAKNVGTFVSKFLGHMTLFAILAVFSMNVFRFVWLFRPLERFLAYTMMALPSAAITEIAQRFIPGRYGRLLDVIIDMTGFYIGTLIIVILKYCLDSRKRKRKRLNERRDNRIREGKIALGIKKVKK